MFKNIFNKINLEDDKNIINKDLNLFKLFSKLDGYAIIIIIILKEDGIEKALDFISKLPLIGFAGIMGKTVFQRGIARLSEVIRDSGESFLMTNIVEDWKIQGKTPEYISKK